LLLKARKREPELLSLLESRGRQVQDQIGQVAALLDHYGFTKQAEEAYRTYVARDPKQPERALALAVFLAHQDRVSEAMEILKKAWSTCRREYVAAAALPLYDAPSVDPVGKAQIKAWLEEAIQQRPEAAPLEPKLGTLLYKEGRFDEAEAVFRQTLAHEPDNAESLNNLAWELVRREPSKSDEALELINRAVQVHGNIPNLVETRGVVLIRANQVDQALRDLRIARVGNPASPSIALHLAWALLASGNTGEAHKEFQEAERLGLKAKTVDPLSRKAIDMLRQALTSNESPR
jgi:Flp pilus assembly protein TadD